MTREVQRPEVSEGRESNARVREAEQTAEKLREGLFTPMDKTEIRAKQIVWGQLSESDLAERNIKTRDAQLDGADGKRRDFPGGVSTFRGHNGEFTLVLPPGAKYKEDKEGNVTATDAKAKPIAEQRADGTMIVHTDTGSYIEGRDGKVTFTPKFKSQIQEKAKERQATRARKAQSAAKRAELRAKVAPGPAGRKIEIPDTDDPLAGLEEPQGSLEDLSNL